MIEKKSVTFYNGIDLIREICNNKVISSPLQSGYVITAQKLWSDIKTSIDVGDFGYSSLDEYQFISYDNFAKHFCLALLKSIKSSDSSTGRNTPELSLIDGHPLKDLIYDNHTQWQELLSSMATFSCGDSDSLPCTAMLNSIIIRCGLTPVDMISPR